MYVYGAMREYADCDDNDDDDDESTMAQCRWEVMIQAKLYERENQTKKQQQKQKLGKKENTRKSLLTQIDSNAKENFIDGEK